MTYAEHVRAQHTIECAGGKGLHYRILHNLAGQATLDMHMFYLQLNSSCMSHWHLHDFQACDDLACGVPPKTTNRTLQQRQLAFNDSIGFYDRGKAFPKNAEFFSLQRRAIDSL